MTEKRIAEENKGAILINPGACVNCVSSCGQSRGDWDAPYGRRNNLSERDVISRGKNDAGGLCFATRTGDVTNGRRVK